MGEGNLIEKGGELVAEELFDLGFASVLLVGAEFAEVSANLIGFEMDALDLVVEAAALDCGPFNDGGTGRAKRIAHVGLLKDFFGAGPGAAVGEELFRGKVFVQGPVNHVEEAEFDGVGEGDAEVQIPRGAWSVGAWERW